MPKMFLTFGSFLAAIGIILGAFGAHALRSRLAPDQLQIFETGVRYQMYHSFALILLFILNGKINSSLLNYSGIFFISGIVLFCGSLYLLACREMLGIDSLKNILGPMTPLGGLCFIIGWICIAIAAIKIKM